jgi:hypothetical protein
MSAKLSDQLGIRLFLDQADSEHWLTAITPGLQPIRDLAAGHQSDADDDKQAMRQQLRPGQS